MPRRPPNNDGWTRFIEFDVEEFDEGELRTKFKALEKPERRIEPRRLRKEGVDVDVIPFCLEAREIPQ